MEFELRFLQRALHRLKLNEDIVVTNNKSESGIYLGRSIVRTGIKPTSINLDNISHAWLYATWLPFKKHAEGLSVLLFIWQYAVIQQSIMLPNIIRTC